MSDVASASSQQTDTPPPSRDSVPHLQHSPPADVVAVTYTTIESRYSERVARAHTLAVARDLATYLTDRDDSWHIPLTLLDEIVDSLRKEQMSRSASPEVSPVDEAL